jgi:hypothetical protein
MKNRFFDLNQFLEESITRSTIYHILEQCDNKISLKRKKGSGRKAIKMPPNKVKSLINHLYHHDGRSQIYLSRKYQKIQAYVFKIIKTKSSIKYRTKEKISS